MDKLNEIVEFALALHAAAAKLDELVTYTQENG